MPYTLLQKCRDIRIGKLGHIFNPQPPCRASETLGSKIGLAKHQHGLLHFSKFVEGDISRLEISRIQDFCSNHYSHLSNKRGGWNKRGGGAIVAKSLNVEGGIFWKKLMHKSNKRGVEGGKNLRNQ